MASRAPKQWCLSKRETITSFEAWRQNLEYTLSLDANFAPFLVAGFTWLKTTALQPLRGLTDDPQETPEANRRPAQQKVTQLDLMLGQIANYCPVISRNSIVKNSTSVNSIWQSIRAHYGSQQSGSHFLDLNDIKLEAEERPEDLYQRLVSFVEDNLLKKDGLISHHGEVPAEDEELTPSLENFVVLFWLRLINPGLPALVKQRYGTELRSKTIATIKPEISIAMDSLLEELNTMQDSKVLRTALQGPKASVKPKRSSPVCPLCKQAGRARFQHYLSSCKFLPESDRQYMGKVRQTSEECMPSEHDNEDFNSDSESHNSMLRITPLARRVSAKKSPTLKVFYGHNASIITLDSGAELNIIKLSVVKKMGIPIAPASQTALQADGVTPLPTVGEIHIQFTRGNRHLTFDALVVEKFDVDVLGGIPFLEANDITLRPAKHEITIGSDHPVFYGSSTTSGQNLDNRPYVLRVSSSSTVIWPGDYLEVQLPTSEDPDTILAVEPRSDCASTHGLWPQPQILDAVDGMVRILNDSGFPQKLGKHDHFCQVLPTVTMTKKPHMLETLHLCKSQPALSKSPSYNTVNVDPDNSLPTGVKQQFISLHKQYSNVFSPSIPGYNGAYGPFEAKVNIGPAQPPQRKGRVPQYARDKLIELQAKFDELEGKGVFVRPEDVNVNVEYLNPSFLVKKAQGGYRLVTAFSDVARYSKPQPSLMPDVDSILRTIAPWKYIIVSDLTSAFYQIPLSTDSMKYCGVATPFKGVRVYTRTAMGMPGSETALEELMCRVLGDFLQEGFVAKLADDLYCGGDTPADLLANWSRVLTALDKANLKLSPSKTVVCPTSTTILGWTWCQGRLSASKHKLAVLSTCPAPDTVKGLRAFIGAYKVLGRVIPNVSTHLSPLDDAVAGRVGQDKLNWTDELVHAFKMAQSALNDNKSITLPQPNDQLWIVTDGSVVQRGIGATMYITRDAKLHLAGFFSAKLRKHQVTWLPCEIEALSIGAAVKHFSPYIIQSKHQACVLTDSQPCVQAIGKLCRGEFSSSPRVTSFLSTVSRYNASLRHLAGSVNLPSDFASRNAPDCHEPNCQICNFIIESEDSVVRSISHGSSVSEAINLPYASRSAWKDIQSQCPDLRHVHAHLRQGTRPSKKLTDIHDVKRYLGDVSIPKDNLLVVRHTNPFVSFNELIVVPRSAADGLATALHIKLNHPTKHQLLQVMKRQFYALDLVQVIDRVYNACSVCASLRTVPNSLQEQSSEYLPETIGSSFAVDVLRRSKQLILVLRETVSSYTKSCFLDNERGETLLSALITLMIDVHPLDDPMAVVRCDPAPGFFALQSDQLLRQYRIVLDIGRVKNPNKNPVAEKAIFELESEIVRQEPGGHPITNLQLATATARLNSRLRHSGLSSREIWTQRSQFTNDQIPLADRELIIQQHENRSANHSTSAKSKAKGAVPQLVPEVSVGDLVYLYSDKKKHQCRDRYLVVSIDSENKWCFVKKFIGNQLRALSYKVKIEECYRVPCQSSIDSRVKAQSEYVESDSEDIPPARPPVPACVPPILVQPDIENVSPDVLSDRTLSDQDNPEPIHADTEAVPSSLVPPSASLSRPQRVRKPPKHLEDYVLN